MSETTVTEQDRENQRRPRPPTASASVKQIQKQAEKEAILEQLPDETRGMKLPNLEEQKQKTTTNDTVSSFSKVAEGSAKLSAEKRLRELGQPGQHSPLQTGGATDISVNIEQPEQPKGSPFKIPIKAVGAPRTFQEYGESPVAASPQVNTSAPQSGSIGQEGVKRKLRILIETADPRLEFDTAHTVNSTNSDSPVMSELGRQEAQVVDQVIDLLSQTSDPQAVLEDIGHEEVWVKLQTLGADDEIFHRIHMNGVGAYEKYPDHREVNLWTGELEPVSSKYVGQSDLERKIENEKNRENASAEVDRTLNPFTGKFGNQPEPLHTGIDPDYSVYKGSHEGETEAEAADSETRKGEDWNDPFDLWSGEKPKTGQKGKQSRLTKVQKETAKVQADIDLSKAKMNLAQLKETSSAVKNAERAVGYLTEGKRKVRKIIGYKDGYA